MALYKSIADEAALVSSRKSPGDEFEFEAGFIDYIGNATLIKNFATNSDDDPQASLCFLWQSVGKPAGRRPSRVVIKVTFVWLVKAAQCLPNIVAHNVCP